jgi:hypothetical protein
MPASYQFLRKSIIFISWEDYEQDNKDESEEEDNNEETDNLKDDINTIIQKEDLPFELNDNEIIPKDDDTYTEYYVDGLRSIIKFLNDNDIPWVKGIVPFTRDDQPGILAIKDESIVVGYVTDDLELDNTYYPIGGSKKLT